MAPINKTEQSIWGDTYMKITYAMLLVAMSPVMVIAVKVWFF